MTLDGKNFAVLAERLRYRFRQPELLVQAMAHRSWCAENPGITSNERLEFLGDAVLGVVVAETVYLRHADLAEGKLTDLRKSVVNAGALAEIAVTIGLGEFVMLGRGERQAGGEYKPSILSDALEAVFGAVYLDGGYEQAHILISRLVAEPIEAAIRGLDSLDNKTVLQELVARRFGGAPVYVITDSGPDHAKEFTAAVMIHGESYGRGVGKSKKQAEQGAARQAVLALRAAPPTPEASHA